MATILKPKVLPQGAHFAIVSPASTPRPDKVEQGITALHALGYRTTLFPHALGYRTTLFPHALDKGPLYYAGNAAHRLADLHEAFANPDYDAVLCTRGGWGSAELLPHLDLAMIADNPKPFLGYSDHTSLHAYLLKTIGLVTFYAPMCAADFSRPDGYDPASWGHALGGSSNWSLTAEDGLKMLRPGYAQGQLVGGCLSIYNEALGTPYAPALPDGPTILFLEDIGTKPYQWDRYLVHLRYAGHLEKAHGIVFGDMSQNVPEAEYALLEKAILHALADFKGPIAIGLRSGHVDAPNITLPLGIQAELDLTAAPRLTYLESAVS